MNEKNRCFLWSISFPSGLNATPPKLVFFWVVLESFYMPIFLSVRFYQRGFLYCVSVCCNWNDWCPAGISKNNMHIKTALCLVLFTACFLLCELPDTFAQSHLLLRLHSTFICLLLLLQDTIDFLTWISSGYNTNSHKLVT